MENQENLLQQFVDIFSRKTYLSLRSRSSLPRYLRWLFEDIDLNDAVVFDIGGGTGLISFYAVQRGARSAVCVEPLADGSRSDMLASFQVAAKSVAGGERVKLETVDLATFATLGLAKADIVVLHNVVNHLDEAACAELGTGNREARDSFVRIFETVRSLMREDGTVIVADAGRDSFWTDLGVRNVFAPTIDRTVHQQPEVWRDLMEEAGFINPSIRWTPFFSLMTGIGEPPKKLGARALSAYYSLGHFVITMRAP
jgi:SAM-dependent methyltransferase